MIKNIIFDLGDVLINLDRLNTQTELKKLGLYEFSKEMTDLNLNYEKGLVSTEAFISYYKNIFKDRGEDELVKMWNAILSDFPEYRLKFLENIDKKYSLFLFSNSNELHLNYFKKKAGDDFYSRFSNCFEKEYYSFQVNLRKPDPEAFQFILDENKLKPEETLFIDDTKENTDSAKKLGMRVWNLQAGKEDVTDLFQKFPSLEKTILKP
ncbi:MAG: HAD family phosphatase [Flavobacteriia bacterium]|nr:MAG: HAD family phosphatase [Flavobacteriia bacterium]